MFLTADNLTLLQREEIRRGREAHLCEEAMAVFSDPHLNYRKMSVLRTALTDGIDPDKLKPLARAWIPSWQVEELTEEIRSGTQPQIPARPFPLRVFLCGLAAIVLVLPLPFLFSPEEDPGLVLNTDEVHLSCGMKFNPENYVRNAKEAEAEGGKLILPEEFTADNPGTRLVQYRLEKGKRVIRKNLRVTITDETAPVLKLKTEKTELLRETPFSCQSYVFSAEDNVDGDLKRKVQCSDSLKDAETQNVRYTVTDSSGNEAAAFLQVHFADYPKEEEPAESVPSPPTQIRPSAAVPPAPVPTPAPPVEPLLS